MSQSDFLSLLSVCRLLIIYRRRRKEWDMIPGDQAEEVFSLTQTIDGEGFSELFFFFFGINPSKTNQPTIYSITPLRLHKTVCAALTKTVYLRLHYFT